MDDTLKRYWGAARQLLLQFRAGAFGGSPDQLHTQLLAAAHQIDLDYRSSNYNLPSLYQDQINLIKGQTVKLAQKWLDDGRPQVPAV